VEKILVVEDAPDYQLMVQNSLGRYYRLELVSTISQAKDKVEKESFDLIILDVGLPDGDGLKLCADLRSAEKTRLLPVILLTGRSDLGDKLKGFAQGADDYIVKPFESLELRARVEAKLMRSREKRKPEDVLIKGAIRLEISSLRAYAAQESGQLTEMGLTPIEFKILYYLARNETKVVSREELLASVWGKETHVFDRAADKHVSSLRQKLGDHSSYIETISRVGYRFQVR
jgi:DNA-binding response OmpR family regulator